MNGEKEWTFKLSRIRIYITHSILASIFIFLYAFFDLGYMKVLLFIEAIFFIRSMRLTLYVKDDHLYYRTLFKTEYVSIFEIDRIVHVRKTSYGAYTPTVSYYYHVYARSDDPNSSYVWEIPADIIPYDEQIKFEKYLLKKNPEAIINLRTPVFSKG